MHLIEQKGRIYAYEVTKNLLNFQYLRVLENMIKLGFYKMESELISILDPLINLLDGSLDFYSPEEVKDFERQLQDNEGKPDFQATIVRTDAMKELRYKRS